MVLSTVFRLQLPAFNLLDELLTFHDDRPGARGVYQGCVGWCCPEDISAALPVSPPMHIAQAGLFPHLVVLSYAAAG